MWFFWEIVLHSFSVITVYIEIIRIQNRGEYANPLLGGGITQDESLWALIEMIFNCFQVIVVSNVRTEEDN